MYSISQEVTRDSQIFLGTLKNRSSLQNTLQTMACLRFMDSWRSSSSLIPALLAKGDFRRINQSDFSITCFTTFSLRNLLGRFQIRSLPTGDLRLDEILSIYFFPSLRLHLNRQGVFAEECFSSSAISFSGTPRDRYCFEI